MCILVTHVSVHSKPHTRTAFPAACERTSHLVCSSCKRKLQHAQTCLVTWVCLTQHPIDTLLIFRELNCRTLYASAPPIRFQSIVLNYLSSGTNIFCSVYVCVVCSYYEQRPVLGHDAVQSDSSTEMLEFYMSRVPHSAFQSHWCQPLKCNKVILRSKLHRKSEFLPYHHMTRHRRRGQSS
jgi:hypothetical protein